MTKEKSKNFCVFMKKFLMGTAHPPKNIKVLILLIVNIVIFGLVWGMINRGSTVNNIYLYILLYYYIYYYAPTCVHEINEINN